MPASWAGLVEKLYRKPAAVTAEDGEFGLVTCSVVEDPSKIVTSAGGVTVGRCTGRVQMGIRVIYHQIVAAGDRVDEELAPSQGVGNEEGEIAGGRAREPNRGDFLIEILEINGVTGVDRRCAGRSGGGL